MFEYIKDIAHFNPDQFHLLRPVWLWGFVVVLVVALIIVFTSREDRKWKKVIAPALQPFMFTKEKRAAVTFPLIAFVLISTIGILALAGPTWEKVDVPGARSEAVLMIAVDCSLSMMAEDVQPNRLERAKFKIRDLLDANPGSKVSLYAYSGTAHTVVPMCNDYRLITHHLESLSPGIMPVQGTNLELLMQLADTTLAKVTAPSTLLLVTDAVDENQALLIEDFVNSSIHRVEVLTLATQQGAQIPKNENKESVSDRNGNIVVSSLDPNVLFQLQKHKRINVNTLTLDNSDMELIAANVRKNLEYQADDEESDEQWKDMGFVLLIFLVLLLPFWFRKGWMIQYSFIPILFFMSSCSGDMSWQNLWYSKDFQGQKLYNNQNYDEAGNTFETEFYKGVAYYKAGNFDAAAQAFEKDSSANSLFNLGMAYSQMGRYDEALQAIELAAEKDPGNEKFQEAINETTKTIGVVDSLRNEGGPIELPEEEEKEAGKLEERKASSKDEELSSDTEVEELPEDGKRVTDEVETDQRKAEEMEEVPDDFQSGSGEKPQNILLREISADPGEFLRRRFEYQRKKYHQNLQELEEKW
ncbi:VWA domain-containing protein [uncultured Draconibacterium sp.]|uniref:vWA domain-containing protein n=1 Tax=uncultured Draconibacterium sp. TaxID=1573823 RepID=UPI0032179DDB